MAETTFDDARFWLNDHRGEEVTLDVIVEQADTDGPSFGPVLAVSGSLEYADEGTLEATPGLIALYGIGGAALDMAHAGRGAYAVRVEDDQLQLDFRSLVTLLVRRGAAQELAPTREWTPNPTLPYTQLAFRLNTLLDLGRSVSIDETERHISDGSLWVWLTELFATDHFEAPPRDMEAARVLLAFQRLNEGAGAGQVGVGRNGLAMCLAYCIEALQAGPAAYEREE